MRKIVAILLFLTLSPMAFAGEQEVRIDADWGTLYGTLAVPEDGATTAVVIVAGSGPTDRNCNSSLQITTYAYKMLSDALVDAGYAVLRYDKRAIGMSYAPREVVLSAVFSDFVDDAANNGINIDSEYYEGDFLRGLKEAEKCEFVPKNGFEGYVITKNTTFKNESGEFVKKLTKKH